MKILRDGFVVRNNNNGRRDGIMDCWFKALLWRPETLLQAKIRTSATHFFVKRGSIA